MFPSQKQLSQCHKSCPFLHSPRSAVHEAEATAGLNVVEPTYKVFLNASTDVAPKLFSRHALAGMQSRVLNHSHA